MKKEDDSKFQDVIISGLLKDVKFINEHQPFDQSGGINYA